MKYLIFLMVLSCCGPLFAEKLVVGIGQSAASSVPERIELIKDALIRTGLDFEFMILPNERTLQYLFKNRVALDLYRQPSAVAGLQDVIQIQPPVDKLELMLITHADNAELCNTGGGDLKKYSIAGVIGARFFNLIYSHFSSHFELSSFEQVTLFVYAKRATFTVWPESGLNKVQKETGTNLHVCSERSPYLTLNFYSYIHKDYSWAIPQIEKAYLETFDQSQ